MGFETTTFYSILNWLLLFGYWLLIAGVALHILMKQRVVSVSMAWLLVIFIVPLFGVVAYLAMGELFLGKRRTARAQEMGLATAQLMQGLRACPQIFAWQSSEVARGLFQLCEHRQGVRSISGNQLQLFTSTDEALQALIRDIDLSQRCVDMVFYIWQAGGLADEVAAALMRAARRGVRCRVLLDSAGSVRFFRSHWPGLLREAGIEVVEALKVRLWRVFLRRMDLRQHRKMVLVDEHIAYTGSLNLVDPRFFKRDAGVGQWVDLMARMEGPVSASMGIVFASDWEMETGVRLLPGLPDVNLMPFERHSGHSIHVIPSGPGFAEELIHQALLTAIYAANDELVLTTPYFVPSDELLLAICTAAQRGVAVSLVVPAKNDSLLVGWASRTFFSDLLAAGVKIFQFSEGLLHTKSVLVDGQLCLLGTVNLDKRSLWLNFELTLVIDDARVGADLSLIQQDYIRQSQQLDADLWHQRPLWQRLLERVFYFFSPLL